MEEIETKLAQKTKPSLLLKDEKKIKEEKLRKKPKYQKMIEKNYDVCRSLRGFKNMQPNQFDFFELVNQLKVIEKEKMKDMADGMQKNSGGSSGVNLLRGFTQSASKSTFKVKDAMAPFAHLFAKKNASTIEESSIFVE